MTRLTYLMTVFLLMGCGGQPPSLPAGSDSLKRIVSLDYCADQYVLKLADRNEIAALSPDATSSFSYMREEAHGIPQVRPRAEDILVLNPDIVVRTYGGGPNISTLLQRVGIQVVQVPYAADLETVKQAVQETAKQLGSAEKATAIIADMNNRIVALPENNTSPAVMYLTSKGVTAGRNTLIDGLIKTAGLDNFLTSQGWSSLPLESLAYQSPELIATGFFETSDLTSDIWTSARHPVAQRVLAKAQVVNLPGAWTSCGAWSMVDAVEALASFTQESTAEDD